MKVLCRSQSGEWVKWRVGRRRAKWFGGAPDFLGLEIVLSIMRADPEAWLLLIPVIGWWLLRLVANVVATAVAWPIRAVLGRWTVVAYELDDPTRRPEIRRRVKGRKAADALAREWAAIIERDGTLDPTLAGVASALPAAIGHGRSEH
ncbi:hypothetical protein [Actinoplanes xinjiangensis]|uniref:hypothetical protein n=1 Tax=Actinoplanes xinjiangensis TaxID=512350 RepID=UPI0034194B63